ncbi:MAG: hypothetical protein FIB02_09675 [Desulfuromonas sp.]|nr:hypothetical protein [Desulfuromonas sp.]
MDIAGGILKTLKRAATVLRENRIDYCLAGGLAVSLLARPRATEDVDLIVLLKDHELADFEDLIKCSFEVIQVHQVKRFHNASIWRFVLGDGGQGLVLLDLILADREEYRAAIEGATEIIVDGCPINIIAPHDLITVKTLAGRPIDLLDIEALQEAMKSADF